MAINEGRWINMGQFAGTTALFLPQYADVLSADPNDYLTKKKLRHGETIAIVMTMALGSYLSVVTGEHEPFFLALFYTTIIVGLYELAMRRNNIGVTT